MINFSHKICNNHNNKYNLPIICRWKWKGLLQNTEHHTPPQKFITEFFFHNWCSISIKKFSSAFIIFYELIILLLLLLLLYDCQHCRYWVLMSLLLLLFRCMLNIECSGKIVDNTHTRTGVITQNSDSIQKQAVTNIPNCKLTSKSCVQVYRPLYTHIQTQAYAPSSFSQLWWYFVKLWLPILKEKEAITTSTEQPQWQLKDSLANTYSIELLMLDRFFKITYYFTDLHSSSIFSKQHCLTLSDILTIFAIPINFVETANPPTFFTKINCRPP